MSCCKTYDPCLDGKLNQIGSYASVARQSAQAATASANSAADSAESAAESAAAARFYLGAFAVAPTTNNEGGPLEEGMLYYNTVSNGLFVWNGTVWASADFNEFTNFLAAGTTTPRNLVTRMADVANVKDFGAIGDGIADDTAAFQTALNSGAKLVYIPPTSEFYIVGQLTMPTTTGFVLQGSGSASLIKQKSVGSVLTWPSRSTDNLYPVQTIKDLHFDGSLGTDHIVNTSYVGNVEFLNCSVRNIPTNKSAFYVNGNPNDGTYTHDIYFNSIDIINNTSFPGSGFYGISGIQLGPRAADIEINEFTFNGNFITQNGIVTETGCGSVHIESGHIYNTISPIISIVNPADVIRMNGIGIDNSLADIVRIENANGASIQNCRIQAVQSGQNGITLVNCTNTGIGSTNFDGLAGAVSAVKEIGACDYTIVTYPIFTNINQFSNTFDLVGMNSFVRGAFRNNLRGYLFTESFAGQTQITAGSTVYLGPNGQQANAINNYIISPYDGIVESCTVATNVAPGAGQSLTINLYLNGVLLSTGTISGASQFLVNLTIPAPPTSNIAKGTGYLTIEVIASAGAASSTLRGFITIQA